MKKIFLTEYGKFMVDTEIDKKIAGILSQGCIQHEDEIKLLQNYVNKDSVVVDVGAHIGTTTIPFAPFVAKVKAFEPLPQNIAMLRENIAQNNLSNIEVYEMGLSNKDMSMVAEIQNKSSSATSQLFDPSEKTGDSIKVHVRVFDEINAGEKCDLIKIDTEGMDFFVIQGAESTIKRYRPVIYFELGLFALRLYKQSPRDIERFFRAHNYRLFLPRGRGIEPILSLPLTTFLTVPRAWIFRKDSNVFNILALPVERAGDYSSFSALVAVMRQLGSSILRGIKKLL